MFFTFFEQYKDYSTLELLKIVMRPEDYQAAAVAAAASRLQEREVTTAEREEVDRFFQALEEKKKARTVKNNAYKEKLADVFEPVLHPGETVKPEKWLTLFLLVFGIQFVSVFYYFIKFQVSYLRCQSCHWAGEVIFGYINLIYISILFYLLLKTYRWGWIILFADSLFSVISRLGQAFTFFEFPKFGHADIGTYIFGLLIKAAFAFFLWRREISDFFGISDKIRKRTAWIAVSIGVLWLIVVCIVWAMEKHYR